MGKKDEFELDIPGRVTLPKPSTPLGEAIKVDLLSGSATEEEVKEADMKVCNMALYMLHQNWKNVATPGQAIDMANASVNVCFKRRMLLNMPVGADEKKVGALVVEPL